MKTTQAWGWLAAGVLALGLNGIYHDGGAVWAHRAVDQFVGRIAERTGPVLALAAGRADLLVVRTGMAGARAETASCRLAASLARVQNRMVESRIVRTQDGFAQFEVMSAREEAALSRMEANRARIEAQMARVRYMPAVSALNVRVNCPRVRVKVPHIRIPQVEIPEVSIPAMELGTGEDPI